MGQQPLQIFDITAQSISKIEPQTSGEIKKIEIVANMAAMMRPGAIVMLAKLEVAQNSRSISRAQDGQARMVEYCQAKNELKVLERCNRYEDDSDISSRKSNYDLYDYDEHDYPYY